MQGFAVILAAIASLALVVNRGTDFVRSFDKGDTWPKTTWLVLPFVLGVAVCWGWQQSFIGDLQALVPSLVGKTINTQLGYVLSGLIVGAGAGPWHEALDALSGIAKQTHAAAELPPMTETDVPPDVTVSEQPSEDG